MGLEYCESLSHELIASGNSALNRSNSTLCSSIVAAYCIIPQSRLYCKVQCLKYWRWNWILFVFRLVPLICNGFQGKWIPPFFMPSFVFSNCSPWGLYEMRFRFVICSEQQFSGKQNLVVCYVLSMRCIECQDVIQQSWSPTSNPASAAVSTCQMWQTDVTGWCVCCGVIWQLGISVITPDWFFFWGQSHTINTVKSLTLSNHSIQLNILVSQDLSITFTIYSYNQPLLSCLPPAWLATQCPW